MVTSWYRLQCNRFGFYDPADPVVVKVPWQMRTLYTYTPANFHKRTTALGLKILGSSRANFGNAYSFEKLMLAYCRTLLHALGGLAAHLPADQIPSITKNTGIFLIGKDTHSRYGWFP